MVSLDNSDYVYGFASIWDFMQKSFSLVPAADTVKVLQTLICIEYQQKECLVNIIYHKYQLSSGILCSKHVTDEVRTIRHKTSGFLLPLDSRVFLR